MLVRRASDDEVAFKKGAGSSQEHFQIDYTFFPNLAFLAVSGVLAWLAGGLIAYFVTAGPRREQHVYFVLVCQLLSY